ncbi:hypothetical protein [Methylobacterium sp. yr668]|jgi:hypothetical protein|uniref:hypothetical protein n=1 Tax=Methylobacterium sp. yr668 TaxID=1761801 RepID=UPI0008DF3E77|nr:hypothetical protein [Methylobacterium sp. yr668]SFS72048.1 hypothetical protein SAMN04487845_106141 [Methylobacterium sp. yr668]
MDLTRVRAFAAVLAAKDRDAVLAQMAEGGVLNTPLAAEPVRGTAAIRPVVDAFESRAILEGPAHAAAFFGAAAGPHRLDGMDERRLDAAGRIAEMTVPWRPLPEAIAVRDRLARAAETPTSAATG